MRLKAIAFALMLGWISTASAQNAQNAYYQVSDLNQQSNVALVGHCDSCDSAVCGCEAAPAPACDTPGDCGCADAVCGCEAPATGCDSGCTTGYAPEPTCGMPMIGCDTTMGGCDGAPGCGCGTASGCGLGGGCLGSELGDPFTLFGETPNGLAVGGWISAGYHNKALPLFNSHPDRFNVHQAWLYAEKVADGSNGLGIGGRIDYVYGVDAQDTQAFGIDNDHWDNDWDNGIYGHAIPQLYMEAAYGNASVKVGHFYTLIGWEVVTAPDNFFYSHAYTMYNSEPFTHTGALATLEPSDNMTLYGGYVLGWDSGFEDNGDAFLGGVSFGVGENISLTYATTIGTFAEDSTGVLEDGYMHSIVADVTLTDKLQYIFQSDLLDSEDATGLTVRDTFGINNYLIYAMNDRVSVGGRFEWWQVSYDSQGFYGNVANPAAISAAAANLGEFDVTALTLGINYKVCSNMMLRPEIRWDWVDADFAQFATADTAILENNDDEQTTFGFDAIVTF